MTLEASPAAMAVGGLAPNHKLLEPCFDFSHLHLHHIPKAKELVFVSANEARASSSIHDIMEEVQGLTLAIFKVLFAYLLMELQGATVEELLLVLCLLEATNI